MNGNTFRTLDFESVRALALTYAGSAPGRARLQALAPLTEPGPVREALSLTTEAVALLRTLGRQPYHDLPDVAESLLAARVSGVHLEAPALSDVASFVEGAVEIGRRVSRAEGTPRLSALASRIQDTSDVAQAIRRAVLPTGEVADDASPRLGDLRRAIVRARASLHSVMESYLRGSEAERLLQDKLVTTRNDRYVLLLKAEHRGAIPGIIHGSSGSGASLFVEPLPAVEINNDIVSLQDDERREVIRILRELTGRVGSRAAALDETVEVLGALDEAQAKALLARDMDASAPEIVEDARLELLRARHPLLARELTERIGLPRRSTRDVVPVTVRVGFGSPVLVISGPNTGGKTVALKTVGLLALMAQCGFHVPAAAGSVLPVFRRVFADIGDDQSISENLSTFSAHLAAIVEMTRDLRAPALVLLDEVGAGTDPTEGGALGVAVVDHFRQRGAMVVATTHHGLMKAYAQSTPGVACASFGYDPRTFEPTFELRLGEAGRSLALEMAERLGLPAAVVQDARLRQDARQAQLEELLKDLEARQARIRAEDERLSAEQGRLRAEEERLRQVEREVVARKRTELEAFARELRKRGEEASRKAADAIRKAVATVEATRRTTPAATARVRTEALREIREAQEEAVHVPELAAAPAAEAEPAGSELLVGGRARLKDLGVVGQVLALQGDVVELAVSGKRLQVRRGEVVPLQPKSTREAMRPVPTPAEARGKPAGASDVPLEINVVGLRVDEALPRVDKVLDEAALADRRLVRVIHGHGAGTLRRAVAEMLDGHPHVAGFRPGEPREGGGGVTVVELKE